MEVGGSTHEHIGRTDQKVPHLHPHDPSRLGVTGASVSAYETGTRLPSYDILVKVSNILGVSTDTLLGRGKAGAVTVDVTGLTEEQRHLIRSTVEIFQQYNALRTTGGEGGDP